MKNPLPLALLALTVIACNKTTPLGNHPDLGENLLPPSAPAAAEPSPSAPNAVIVQVLKGTRASLLPMDVSMLTEADPARTRNFWSSPSVYSLLGSSLFISHLNPATFTEVSSFYSTGGKELYSTANNLAFYDLDGVALVIESFMAEHEVYFIKNPLSPEFTKISSLKLKCQSKPLVSQSATSKQLEVKCESDGQALVADYEALKILAKVDPTPADWYPLEKSNTTHRLISQQDQNFKSTFTTITDKVVFPRWYDSFSTANRFMTMGLTGNSLSIYDSQKINDIVIPLDETGESEVSYLIMKATDSSTKSLIMKESADSKINLISVRPPFGKPIRLTNDQLLLAFCKTATKEGKPQKQPLAYRGCLSMGFEKLIVEDNVALVSKDQLLVQVRATEDEKGISYKGALLLDSNLNVLRTIELQRVFDTLQFVASSKEIYSASETILSRFNEQGELESWVNYCQQIPKCRADQVKAIVPLENGVFVFTQALVHMNETTSPELIFEVRVR